MLGLRNCIKKHTFHFSSERLLRHAFRSRTSCRQRKNTASFLKHCESVTKRGGSNTSRVISIEAKGNRWLSLVAFLAAMPQPPSASSSETRSRRKARDDLEQVLGLTKPGRPRGSFLSLDPTGVAKTELITIFTHVLCGLEYLFRFDMSRS